MRLTAALLVLCVFTEVAESQAVIARRAPWQSERNLLTLAISGIQDAVGAAMSVMLDAATTLTQDAFGAAEGVTEAAIQLAVKLGEKLVNHNTFAVKTLQCLAGAATQAAVDTVAQVQGAIADSLNLRGKQQQAEAAQERGLPGEVAGAVSDCVMQALRASVRQLEDQALKLVGNGSRIGTAAVEALAKAIEKHVKDDPAVLRSLGVAEQVARSLSHEADLVIDGRAHNADDSRRNILKDVVDRMNAAMAENLAQWTDNATSAAEIKAKDLVVQAEKAADEALRKAQQVVDENLVEGSDWEKALVALLKKPERAKERLASSDDVEVRSAADVAHQV